METKLTLKTKLLDNLSKKKLQLEEIIFFNLRKKRFTILVSNSKGSRYILKWEDISVIGKSFSLCKEIAFYTKYENRFNFFPVLTDVDSNSIRMDYFDSITLREWLIDNKVQDIQLFQKAINNIIIDLDLLYKTEISGNNKEINFNKFIGKLMLSGPMNTKRTAIELTISRILNKLLGKLINPYFNLKYQQLFKAEKVKNFSLVHGDLHLNNVLINEQMDYKIIDWENAKNDFWILDLVYFLSNTIPLLENPAKRYLLAQIETIIFQNEKKGIVFFKRVLNIHIRAVCTNRRFLDNSSVPKLIWSYLALLFQIAILLLFNSYYFLFENFKKNRNN